MRPLLLVCIVLALITTTEFSFAQNLVPNPSFETYTTCPVGPSEMGVATPWTQPTSAGTSDYFNVCNQSPFPFPVPIPGFGAPVGVPYNALGNQQAHTDSAYAGFFSVEAGTDDGYREYIEVPLTEPMQPGVNYCVQFYLSLGDNSANATNGIGAYFSTSQVTQSGNGILPYTPQFRYTSVVDDKVNWVEVNGSILANQAYTYLTIGNFDAMGTSTITTVQASPDTNSPIPSLPTPGAYYYIDDVYVGAGSCPNICGLGIEATTSPVSCAQADGAIDLNVTGGSGSFTYEWSTGDTTSDVSGLEQGVYSVTVSDSLGCDVVQYVMLEQNTTLDIEVEGINAGCTSTGSATVNITGGTTPYQITWENNQTTSTISNLNAGTYSVVVEDAEGCLLADSVEITVANSFSINESIVNADCAGGSNGSIGVTPVGGTPPYSYSWSTGSSNASISGLAPGTYTVTINDGGGCTNQETYTITSGGSFAVTATQNGNLLTASSATSYQWYYNGSPISGATSQTYTITESGSYWVVAYDGSGCQAVSNVIEATVSGIETEELVGLSLNLYPNPSNGNFVLNIEADKDQKLELRLRNYLGQAIYYSNTNVSQGSNVVTFELQDIAKGTYILEIINKEMSTFRKVLVN